MYTKRNKGHSLIEIIIYIAIFSALFVVVINSIVVVFRTYGTTRTNRDLQESGSIVMERLVREIHQAKNIDVTNSVLATSPGVLQLNSTTQGGTVTVMRFVTSNGALNLYQDGTIIGNLLGQNVTVTSLIFRRITTTNGEAVKIEMTLRDNRSPSLKQANFYNTVILRGSYQ